MRNIMDKEVSEKLVNQMVRTLEKQYRASGRRGDDLTDICREEVVRLLGERSWPHIFVSVSLKPEKIPKFRALDAGFNDRLFQKILDFGARCDAISIQIKSSGQLYAHHGRKPMVQMTPHLLTQDNIADLIEQVWGHDPDLLGKGTYSFTKVVKISGLQKEVKVEITVDDKMDKSLDVFFKEDHMNVWNVNYSKTFATLPDEALAPQKGFVIVSHNNDALDLMCPFGSSSRGSIASNSGRMIHYPVHKSIRLPINPNQTSLIHETHGNKSPVYTHDDCKKARGLPPHALAILCSDEIGGLTQAMIAQRGGTPVYLGISGWQFTLTNKMERAADALIATLHRLPQNDWKPKAREIIENLHSIVAICKINRYRDWTAAETLMITKPVRKALLTSLDLATDPDDLYPCIAKMMIQHGVSMTQNADVQLEEGLIDRDVRDWIAKVDGEWRKIWCEEAPAD